MDNYYLQLFCNKIRIFEESYCREDLKAENCKSLLNKKIYKQKYHHKKRHC